LTQPIDPAGEALLQEAGVDLVRCDAPAPIGREALLAQAAGCAGLLCMPSDRVDAAVMDAGPLRVISNHAVGVDNIDLDAARSRGIVVTNTPGVLTEATADLAMTLLLAAARRVIEGDRLVREGLFTGWGPLTLRGADLWGARLGIVGMGRIGSAVARRAEAFGMEIVHHSRSGGLALSELVETSDFISLHCPLTAGTRHLIGEAELRSMKETAILVNTARGAVVDEAALARALAGDWIAGAGLDVFEDEPRAHPDLLGLENVVLLPHLGSATWRTRRRMATLAARNLIAALRGETPPHPIA
jgi:glyoxylate reductase